MSAIILPLIIAATDLLTQVLLIQAGQQTTLADADMAIAKASAAVAGARAAMEAQKAAEAQPAPPVAAPAADTPA